MNNSQGVLFLRKKASEGRGTSEPLLGGVPTTLDPNTSAKHRDTNGRRIVIQIGGVNTTFCQEEGILLPKCCDRSGRCIAILFNSIRVRGRVDSADLSACRLPAMICGRSDEVCDSFTRSNCTQRFFLGNIAISLR